MFIHQRRWRMPGWLLLATGLSMSLPAQSQDDDTAEVRDKAVE
jgi:hypothetical protein